MVNPFPLEQGPARIIQTSKVGDEPNATLHFPLRPTRLSQSDNYDDDDDDVNGVPIGHNGSDEEDTRPYKVLLVLHLFSYNIFTQLPAN